MVGMMLWEPSGHWTRPVTLKEVSVLPIRFLCARMAQDRRRNPLTERRRLRTAGKKLLCHLASDTLHSVVHGLWRLADQFGNFPA